MTASWDRQAGETAEWYDRFKVYLYMGPDRTVAAAHTFVSRFAKGAAQTQLRSWERAARKYEWKARAEAFDAELRHKTLAHDERLKMVAELLHQVYGVLCQADMLTLSKEEARQLLPTFRLFFRDILQFHQIEAARFLGTKEGESKKADKAGAELSADELMTFLTEMDGVKVLLAEVDQVTNAPATEASWLPLRDMLVELYPDEASARRLAAEAELESARIHFAARAVDRWHAILTEAVHVGSVEALILVVQREYPKNANLRKAVRYYRHSLRLVKKG
jgi:hypothetical protein